MNWVDLVVLAVLALSGLLALMRGLVREVLGVGAWVGAALVASPYGAFPYVQPFARQHISDPTIADVVAIAAVFLAMLVIFWIVASAIGNAIRGSVLGGLDRTLGFVFGLVRGAVLVAALYVLAGKFVPIAQWPEPVTEARSMPLIRSAAIWLVDQVPPAYRPAVPDLPAGRPTTAASLLQSSPTGRALGARPARE